MSAAARSSDSDGPEPEEGFYEGIGADMAGSSEEPKLSPVATALGIAMAEPISGKDPSLLNSEDSASTCIPIDLSQPLPAPEGGGKIHLKRGKGRKKIPIKFIADKTKRHITFSKRKAGIMKKAYEFSMLTGTEILVLVASETGHVYTFATPRLQSMITEEAGKRFIQACLNGSINTRNTANPSYPEREAAHTPSAIPQAPFLSHLASSSSSSSSLGHGMPSNLPSPHPHSHSGNGGPQRPQLGSHGLGFSAPSLTGQSQPPQHLSSQSIHQQMQHHQQQQQHHGPPHHHLGLPPHLRMNPGPALLHPMDHSGQQGMGMHLGGHSGLSHLSGGYYGGMGGGMMRGGGMGDHHDSRGHNQPPGLALNSGHSPYSDARIAAAQQQAVAAMAANK